MACSHTAILLTFGLLLPVPRAAVASSPPVKPTGPRLPRRAPAQAHAHAEFRTKARPSRLQPPAARQPKLVIGAGGFEEGTDFDEPQILMKTSGRPGHQSHVTRMLYDHMPKAGGTFLIRLFRQSVRSENFEYVSEFKNISEDHVHSRFVVGSVRNPCNYYLSLWAYGVEHGGAMMSRIPKEKQYVYRPKSPHKNTSHDIKLFREWIHTINHKGFPGVMSVRFARSYAVMDTVIGGQAPPMSMRPFELESVRRALSTPDFLERVKCWVKAEHMNEDAKECLRAWHRETGQVINWQGFKEVAHKGQQLASRHGDCRAYFSPKLVKMMYELEHPIFKYFHYDSCCA